MHCRKENRDYALSKLHDGIGNPDRYIKKMCEILKEDERCWKAAEEWLADDWRAGGWQAEEWPIEERQAEEWQAEEWPAEEWQAEQWLAED